MSKKAFCHFETERSGERITHIDQIDYVKFTGRELYEYCEEYTLYRLMKMNKFIYMLIVSICLFTGLFIGYVMAKL